MVQLEGRSLGWKCVYALGSSTELPHESATNISTQELCHNDCMYNIQLHTYICMYVFMMQMLIADDQETFSLWGKNLKIFMHAICVYVIMYMCRHKRAIRASAYALIVNAHFIDR